MPELPIPLCNVTVYLSCRRILCCGIDNPQILLPHAVAYKYFVAHIQILPLEGSRIVTFRNYTGSALIVCCADIESYSTTPFRALSWRRNERGGEFFVEGEEVFHALAVAVERLRAVAAVNGAVEVGVGFD